MSDTIKSIARRLGMRESEIIETVLDADGVLVQTHDGVWTLICNDGELEHRVAGPTPVPDPDGIPAEVLEDVVDLAEAFTEEAAAKPAPKRRSRA